LSSSDRSRCIALSQLASQKRARLCDHGPRTLMDARLADLGLVPGTSLEILRRAPLGGPIEIELRGYRLVLRRADAAGVCVRPEAE